MKIINYQIKAMNIDAKQSKSTIKVPFPVHKLVKEAFKTNKRLKVTIETIENDN